MNTLNHHDIPMGFGMALAQNTDAMQYFSNLSDEEKRSVISGTHALHSKAEMQHYVNELGQKNHSHI